MRPSLSTLCSWALAISALTAITQAFTLQDRRFPIETIRKENFTKGIPFFRKQVTCETTVTIFEDKRIEIISKIGATGAFGGGVRPRVFLLDSNDKILSENNSPGYHVAGKFEFGPKTRTEKWHESTLSDDTFTRVHKVSIIHLLDGHKDPIELLKGNREAIEEAYKIIKAVVIILTFK